MFSSQPLNEAIFNDELKKLEIVSEDRKILSQYMGNMFDDMSDVKITIGGRLCWLKRNIKELFYDIKYAVRNWFKWIKVIARLRPWEGFWSMLIIMQYHLNDYIDNEEKFGNSEESYRQNKINTAKETVQILKRLEDTMEYSSRRLEPIYAKYPKYLSMISKSNNLISFSGQFIQLDNDIWVGQESGSNPRRGCFCLIGEKFELVESPNPEKTNMLLEELDNFNEEISHAYKLAKKDIQDDFYRLYILLSENLHKWWN